MYASTALKLVALASLGISGCVSFIKSAQTIFPAGSVLQSCASHGIVAAPPDEQAQTLALSLQDVAMLSTLLTETSVDPTSATRLPQASRNLYESRVGAGEVPGVRTAALASAKDALNALGSPTHRKLLDIMAMGASPAARRLTDGQSGSKETAEPGLSQVKIDRREWVDYSITVSRISMTDGWTALSIASDNIAESTRDPHVRSVASALSKESEFISAYIAAYFRQGHVIALTVSPQTLDTDLHTRVDQWAGASSATAAKPAIDSTVDQLMGEILPSDCKKAKAGGAWPPTCDLIGSVGDSGFVSRGGDKYAFPALNFVVDPLGQQKLQKPQVDLSKVGADLVRVLVEAAGDSLARVPAVQGSTACSSGLLPCFNPAAGVMSADNFAKVSQYGAMSEAVVAQATGTLIRGGFLFALNNETVAQVIETGISVAARKSAEKVAWDYFSCTGSTKEFRAVAVDAIGYRAVTVSVK
jgi:hypothetical protein